MKRKNEQPHQSLSTLNVPGRSHFSRVYPSDCDLIQSSFLNENTSCYKVQDEENRTFTLYEGCINEEDSDSDQIGERNESKNSNQPKSQFSDLRNLENSRTKRNPEPGLTRWVSYPWGDEAMQVVTCLAFSPDGWLVACGGVAKKGRAPVSVFSLVNSHEWEAGKLVADFFQRNLISSLSFLPDSNKLIVTDFDGVVAVYDVRRQRGLYFDRHHPSKINCHAVLCERSLTGCMECTTTLAIGTVDRKVRLYNMEKFEALKYQIKYTTEVRALAMTSMDFEVDNLKVIVVGGSQTNLSVYREDGSHRGIFHLVLLIPVQGQTNSMSISGKDVILQNDVESPKKYRHLAFGGLDKQVTVVELESSASQGTLRWEFFGSFGHQAPVASCSLSADGWLLAVGDDAGKVKLYNVNTGAQVIGYKFSDRIKGVAISADGRLLAVAGFDCQLHISDIRTGFELFLSLHHNSKRKVQSVSLSEDGCFLALATHDGYTFVYHMHQETVVSNTEKMQDMETPRKIEEQGKHRLSISDIFRSSVSTNESVLSQVFEKKMDKEVWVVQLSRDGGIVAFGGYDMQVLVYEVQTGMQIAKFQQEWFVWSLSLHIERSLALQDVKETPRTHLNTLKCALPTKQLLAVGDWSGRVCVYDLKTKETVYKAQLGDRVFSVVFSHCGNFLALGGRDGIVQLHFIPNKAEPFVHNLLSLPKQKVGKVAEFTLEDRVYCTALSAKGSLLAAGGVMSQVVVFDLRDNTERARLPAPMITNYVEFTPDGALLAFGGDQKTLYIYCTKTFNKVIQLPQEDTITSISFSKWGCMALGVGDRLLVYGRGRLHHGVGSQPSFRLARQLLDDSEALIAMLRTHPEVANRFDPGSHETLLHAAVYAKREDAVAALIRAETVIGLSRDMDGKTALHLAVEKNYKEIVKLILQGILDKKFGSQPDSLEPLFHEDKDGNEMGRRESCDFSVSRRNSGMFKLMQRNTISHSYTSEKEHSHTSIELLNTRANTREEIGNDIHIQVGDQVEAAYRGGYDWLPCTVTKITESGLYHLRYEDGEIEHRVSPEFVRANSKLFQPPPSTEPPAVPLPLSVSWPGTAAKGGRQHRRLLDELGERFPDVVLHFLSCYHEEEAEHLVMGPIATAPIQQTLYLTCEKRVPISLWMNYFNQMNNKDARIALKPSALFQLKSRLFRLLGYKPHKKYEVEVKAVRLPLKDFARNLDLSKILCLVDRTMDYKIFEDHTIVTAVLNYKWKRCRRHFQMRLLRFFIFVCVTSTWLLMASKSSMLNWLELWREDNGIVTLALFPFVSTYASYSLFRRIWRQLPRNNVDKRHGRFGRDRWKVLKLLSTVSVLVANVCFLSRSPRFSRYAAFCQILLFVKLISYAQCYERCAITFQVVQQVFLEILPLLVFAGVLLVGFSLSFLTLYTPYGEEMLGNSSIKWFFTSPLSSFFASSLMMFGDFVPVEYLFDLKEGVHEDSFSVSSMIILELFMFFLVLLLLNAIVAKMVRVYKAVERQATFQVRYEKAKMIVEVDSGNHYHRWLHALKPIEQYFPEKGIKYHVQSENADNEWHSSFLEMKKSVDQLSTSVNEMSHHMESNARRIEGVIASQAMICESFSSPSQIELI